MTRIGVTLDQYRAAPKISPILREIQGGKSKAIQAMRFSSSPLILQFFEIYDQISPRDKEKLSLEAIALAAKINILHLWGEIQFAMREHSVSKVKVLAVANHPEVMRRRIEYAQLPNGYRDRDALDIMLGALPTPKNTTNFINKVFTNGAKDESEEDEKPTEVIENVEDFAFPDVSVMQERAQPMRQKLLAGK